MKFRCLFAILTLAAACAATTSCTRNVRTAQDITPGNCAYQRLDWRYGATDIRIQTMKLSRVLMDRWYAKTAYDVGCGRPRIVLTEIDNCTDCYISTDMIRDIFESIAIDDGRFSVVVGDAHDERELDSFMSKISQDPKYANSTRLQTGQAKAPQFLGKIRITKAVTADNYYDYEDYRMTVTLYDIETQEAIDSAWDVLSKKVQR